MNVEILIGKTLSDIERYEDEMKFICTDGTAYKMHHDQDCCEHVAIEEVIGDLEDLIDAPILMAEEVSQEAEGDYESATWTFYKFATIKGYVTIRWLGESNGYYSESVDFMEVKG